MIFTSLSFLVFFFAFFVLYWFVFNKSLKAQNILLLVGSYIFYAWADWRFLPLLIFTSGFNYYMGLRMETTENPSRKKLLLWLSLVQVVGILAFFKYSNFFIDSFNAVFLAASVKVSLKTLGIIVPLGISFYTFRIISYILDIYNGKTKACSDVVVFFNYVSFFPSILSGPIDKSKLLIPQLEKPRVFDYDSSIDGLKQIMWGLFKKLVIANNCALFAGQFFEEYQTLRGSTLLVGAFLYTIQVYADFSGYSDMALGIARLLSFRITKNFDFPFFAQNIAEFWRRWHISLTTWLTEYVFTPLSIAFRNLGTFGLILAIVINFLIIGVWHGPRWTYALYGILHGCFYIPLILTGKMNKKKKIAKDRMFPSIKELANVLGTFALVMLSLVMFRATSISEAFGQYKKIFSFSLFSIPELPVLSYFVLVLIVIFMTIEWFGRTGEYAIQNIFVARPRIVKWSFYYTLILLTILFMGKEQEFIYFQF